jgi:hypothetical protein
MIETLGRICALQPFYSRKNTSEMKERGRLIRHTLPDEFKSMSTELRAALGPRFGAEFDVGESDGMGLKTEAPWVRIFASSLSPNPRVGWYVVVHFAADGSAVFVTVGCGSTVLSNGTLTRDPPTKLAERTSWARTVVRDEFGTLAPFEDTIRLGAKAPLPATFEQATALAHRIPVEELDEARFRELLVLATQRLRCIYEAQYLGRDLTAAAAVDVMVEALAEPVRAGSAGQGFWLTAAERRAVETQAMQLAKVWLESNGYSVKDVSARTCFDFEASKDGQTIKVEVKGTTNESGDAVLMTRNEVDLHKSQKGQTALFVVSHIQLRNREAKPIAHGGQVQVELGWDIDAWEATPIAYRLKRPPLRAQAITAPRPATPS